MIKAANATLFIKNGGNMNMQKVKNVDGNVAKMATLLFFSEGSATAVVCFDTSFLYTDIEKLA